jgi:hypothetical protein
MESYDIAFIISTLWIGPFWVAMLLNPEKEKTKALMKGPWFFIGPILIWMGIMLSDPKSLINILSNPNSSNGFIEGLTAGLSTKAGMSATWAHVVAGDIFVTRWIWQRSLKFGAHPWLTRVCVFFGVMLMPVGLIIHAIFVRENLSK